MRGSAGLLSWSMRRWMNHEKYPAYLAWIFGLRESNLMTMPRQLGRPQRQVIFVRLVIGHSVIGGQFLPIPMSRKAT